MLEIYAVAVARMMALPPADPLSWTYQWYIHAVRDDRSRAEEVAALLPAADRAQAASLWDTCEAHFDPRRVDFFLPWHRLFLWRTERIVRHLTREARFTMPYWNYADPANRALPAEFRRPDDPFWRSLYRAERYPQVNDGAPIDRDAEAVIDLASMMSATYRDSGSDAGFSFNLDNAPHTAVHVDVGDRTHGMGTIAWAANDPIFWLHHCAIDRIWASWNRAGGRNPDEAEFLDQGFVFINETGSPARAAVAEAMTTASLGYAYDSYLARPAGSLPFGAVRPAVMHAALPDGTPPIRLAGDALALALDGAPGRMTLRQAFESDRAFVLRIGGLRTAAQPKISYRVFLGPDAATSGSTADPGYTATISAFGAIPREGDPRSGPSPSIVPRAYSFVVTDRVRELQDAGRVAEVLRVTLAPTGSPVPDADVTLDQIALLSI